MLVGEAPGADEDVTGKPFIGKAGRMLDSFLNNFDLLRDEVFITNAAKCRPPDNRKPTFDEIKACRHYLLDEIRHVKPKVIIALGAAAAESLLLKRKVTISKARNTIQQIPEFPDIKVIVSYHPSGILRTPEYLRPSVEDWEWAMRILKGEEDTNDPDINYRWVDRLGDRNIKIGPICSVDMETDGLDPFLPGREIITIQLSTRAGRAYIFPYTEENADWFEEHVMANSKILKVFHNAKFDIKWWRKAKRKLRGKIFDTMIAAHLCDENMAEKTLDFIASQFTPLKGHKTELVQYMKEHKLQSFRDVPRDILIRYGCADADATLRLYEYFLPQLKQSDKLWKLFQREMEVIKGPLVAMEMAGFKIDVSKVDYLDGYYRKLIRKLKKKMHESLDRTKANYGTELNVNSWQQLHKVIYDQWGFPALGKPKQWGKPLVKNTAEATLEKLISWIATNEVSYPKSKTNVLKSILEIRANRKLLSTYIEGLSDYLRAGDKIHPSFKMHGTVTGRWSCTDPNFQNIPRTGEIKKFFISRFGRAGCIFSGDLSQAELRLAAWDAQELNMIDDLRKGLDIHRITASRVWGIPIDKVNESQRKKAKIINFGILYLSGAATMAEGMGCSEAEAEGYIRRWHAQYPGFKRKVEKTRNEIIKYNQVTNWAGRIRRIPVLDINDHKRMSQALRQGFNSPIQGGVSDYLVEGMLQLYKEMRKRKMNAYIVANVHDEIVIDTLKLHVKELSDLFVDIFENRHIERGWIMGQFNVPFKVETSSGPNWLEQETIHGG